MKQALIQSTLKGSLQVMLTASLTLGACTQIHSTHIENNSAIPLSEARKFEVDKSVQSLKKYLKSLKLVDVNTVLGSTHNERLKSQEWLYDNLAEDLVKHGINKEKIIKIADNDAGVSNLVGKYYRHEARFEDYLRLAEIAVIARVGDEVTDSNTYTGPAFFKLEISNTLSAFQDVEDIVVVNSLNPHHRRLSKGKECVFFLSPTYTRHYIEPGKEYPNLPDYLREGLPDDFLTSIFSTYCTEDGNIFARGGWGIGGSDDISKSEILNLSEKYRYD